MSWALLYHPSKKVDLRRKEGWRILRSLGDMEDTRCLRADQFHSAAYFPAIKVVERFAMG